MFACRYIHFVAWNGLARPAALISAGNRCTVHTLGHSGQIDLRKRRNSAAPVTELEVDANGRGASAANSGLGVLMPAGAEPSAVGPIAVGATVGCAACGKTALYLETRACFTSRRMPAASGSGSHRYRHDCPTRRMRGLGRTA